MKSYEKEMEKPKRVMTSYQMQVEGIEEEVQVNMGVDKKAIYAKIRSWTIFWGASSIVILLLLYGNDIVWMIERTGMLVAIIAVLFLAGSALASHQQIANPMLYVQGTGAMEDITNAKDRAFSFIGPAMGIVIGGILYSISLIMGTLIN